VRLKNTTGRLVTGREGCVTARINPAVAATGVSIRALDNGSYAVDFTPKQLAFYVMRPPGQQVGHQVQVHVMLEGKAVRGSPFALTVPHDHLTTSWGERQIRALIAERDSRQA
jgi:hypothetical protein